MWSWSWLRPWAELTARPIASGGSFPAGASDTNGRAARAARQYAMPEDPRRTGASSPATVSVGMTTMWVGSPGARRTAEPGRSLSPRSTERHGKVRLATRLARTQVFSAAHRTSRLGSGPAAAGIEKATR